MTNTFPLPIECLQLVIGSLAVNKELSTLVSLLRVNKYVCEVTLPFVYENPFVWFDYDPYLVSSPHNSWARDRGYHLVHLFLRFVPQGTCTGRNKVLPSPNLYSKT